MKLTCGTLALGAPSASLPRSGRSAPSLRPLRSVAPGASARSCIDPSARSLHGPGLWSSCCPWPVSVARSEALCAPSPRAFRSLASRPPLPRFAPLARSPCALRSLAPRPSLGRSALSAPSARSFALKYIAKGRRRGAAPYLNTSKYILQR